MASRLNEMENEGLIVIGRPVETEYDSPEPIQDLVEIVEAWAKKLSLPLGLIYCGTTINWPDDVEYTPMVIGLVTFSGYGDDDEPVAGEIGPEEMDLRRADAIPLAFWEDLANHGVEFGGDVDVLLAVAGWTWASLRRDGEDVCGVSAEDDGFTVVPEELRSEPLEVHAGYC